MTFSDFILTNDGDCSECGAGILSGDGHNKGCSLWTPGVNDNPADDSNVNLQDIGAPNNG